MSKVKILLYCTKGKPYLFGHYVGFDTKYQYDLTICKEVYFFHKDVLNGKIVAECECDKVEEIVYNKHWNCYADNDNIESCYFDNDLACLSVEELKNYLGDKKGYALHLSNVEVFDETYDVSDCNQYRKWQTRLKNAPQNMCEVYGKNGAYYILISIQPQHLVYILNGKKTIEVRKSILNRLKELM